jgi:hypothetical protein
MKFAEEVPLLKMSRVFTLLQQMALFGCQTWLGKQSTKVEKDSIALMEEIPDQVCQLDETNPEALYWICVNSDGLKFLQFGKNPCDSIVHCFNLAREAEQRLVAWAAKKNVLQLVVQSPMPGAIVSLSLSLITPPAHDIAHALEALNRTSSSRRRSSFRAPTSGMGLRGRADSAMRCRAPSASTFFRGSTRRPCSTW